MKTLSFFKINFMGVVALLTVALTMSFTLAEKSADRASTIHYYVSDDMAEGSFKQASNWSTTNDDDVLCGSLQIRPCQITVPTGSTLNATLGNRTNSQVLSISEGYKPAP